MRKVKPDHPPIRQEVVKSLVANGKPESIAKDLEWSVSRLSRFAIGDNIIAQVEQEQKKLFEALPDAVENVRMLVSDNKKDKTSKDERKSCYEF